MAVNNKDEVLICGQRCWQHLVFESCGKLQEEDRGQGKKAGSSRNCLRCVSVPRARSSLPTPGSCFPPPGGSSGSSGVAPAQRRWGPRAATPESSVDRQGHPGGEDREDQKLSRSTICQRHAPLCDRLARLQAQAAEAHRAGGEHAGGHPLLRSGHGHDCVRK